MTEPTDEDLKNARVLWHYHRLDDPLEPSDVIIGLGSHDVSVAQYAAELWHLGLAPKILFSGANAPTTVGQFPRGEAVHYREIAIGLGVPEGAVIVETRATNTGENVEFSRETLSSLGIPVSNGIVVTRPYQQRRARATFSKAWPGFEARYSAAPSEFDDYLRTIGDERRVIEMLVGDTQRIPLYARRGYSAPEPLPVIVEISFARLVEAGFVSRLSD